MSFITVAAGQPIRATHVNQFTQWITGTKKDVSLGLTTTSATDYTAVITNEDTTAGLIAKYQYGSGTAATTVMTVNKTGVTINVPTTASGVIQASVLQTAGDMISASAASTPLRIPRGTTPYLELAMNAGATGQTWATGVLATVQTSGDLLYGSSPNSVGRLAKGGDGQVLTLSGGLPAWGAAATAAQSIQSPILNGDFNLWSYGTSFASCTTNTYVVDGNWVYAKLLGTGIQDIAQSTSVPSVATTVPLQNYSIRFTVKTTEAAISTSEYAALIHKIEGTRFLPFAQRAFTLSFYVFSSKTGTYSVGFTNSGGDRSFVGEYTVNAATTWELKTVTVTASPSAGTWNYASGVGLNIWFPMCGTVSSTFAATVGAWTTGNFFMSASNAINSLDTANNLFGIAQIQVDLGTTASAFAPIDPGTMRQRCQRYTYVPTRPLVTYPGRFVGTAQVLGDFPLPTTMRVAPTLTHSITTIATTATVSAVSIYNFDGFTQVTGTFASSDTWSSSEDYYIQRISISDSWAATGSAGQVCQWVLHTSSTFRFGSEL